MWAVRQPAGTLYYHPRTPTRRTRAFWKWVTREFAWTFATEFAAQKMAADIRVAGSNAVAVKL